MVHTLESIATLTGIAVFTCAGSEAGKTPESRSVHSSSMQLCVLCNRMS